MEGWPAIVVCGLIAGCLAIKVFSLMVRKPVEHAAQWVPVGHQAVQCPNTCLCLSYHHFFKKQFIFSLAKLYFRRQ
jgi:hypothetical protein